MGGLAHYLESAGIATTQISLIRLHTEKIRPPRALWVSFELGRPFGPPHDSAFQTRVVVAALRLLNAPSGPVLVDFPEDVPSAAGDSSGWACPVNFARPPTAPSEDAASAAALRDEVARLIPWHDMAVAAHGRTTMGASTLAIEQIVALFVDLLAPEPPTSPLPDLPLADVIRLAAEDLKAFYFEAALAQPGAPSSQQLATWFWRDTSAAKLLGTLKSRFEGSHDGSLRLLGQLLLVPRFAIDLRKHSTPPGTAR